MYDPIYVINLQIHACFASFSSRDIYMYKEISKSEFDKEKLSVTGDYIFEDTEYGLFEIFIEDTTYYNVSIPTNYATLAEMQMLIDKYTLELGYSRNKSEAYNDRYELRKLNEEKIKADERKQAGYIYYISVDWKYDQKLAQGGFSDDLWNYEKTQQYTKSKSFGYFGHNVRKEELDIYIEKALKDIHSKSKFPSIDYREICYSYLSSSDARHMCDTLEDIPFEAQKKDIDNKIKSMWNNAYIYGKKEHDGTFYGTMNLMDKYKEDLFDYE